MDSRAATVQLFALLPLLLYLALAVLVVIVLIKVWTYINTKQAHDRAVLNLLNDIRHRLYISTTTQNESHNHPPQAPYPHQE